MSRRSRRLGVAGIVVAVLGMGVGILFYQRHQRHPDRPPVALTLPMPDRAARLAEVVALANKAAIGPPEERPAAVEQLMAIRQEDWDLLFEAGNAAREAAAELVARILAEEGLPLVDRLAGKLAREDKPPIKIPCFCVRSLGRPAADPVCAHMSSPHVQVRVWVATCLAYFPDQPKVVLPAIECLIDDPDERVIVPALRAVQGHVAQPGTLTEKVRAATKDPRPSVRNEATTALSHLERGSSPDAAIFADIRSAETPLDQRLRLIESLKRRKPTPEVFVALGTCLSDQNSEVQRAALFVLQDLGPQVTTVAPQLLKMATAEKPVRIDLVLSLLSRCKPMAKELEPAAVKYLQSQRLAERCGAAACLANAEGLKEDTIFLLLRSLKDRDVSVRSNAVRALGRCTSRKDVMPALRQLSANDPHPLVRARASAIVKENQGK